MKAGEGGQVRRAAPPARQRSLPGLKYPTRRLPRPADRLQVGPTAARGVVGRRRFPARHPVLGSVSPMTGDEARAAASGPGGPGRDGQVSSTEEHQPSSGAQATHAAPIRLRRVAPSQLTTVIPGRVVVVLQEASRCRPRPVQAAPRLPRRVRLRWLQLSSRTSEVGLGPREPAGSRAAPHRMPGELGQPVPPSSRPSIGRVRARRSPPRAPHRGTPCPGTARGSG